MDSVRWLEIFVLTRLASVTPLLRAEFPKMMPQVSSTIETCLCLENLTLKLFNQCKERFINRQNFLQYDRPSISQAVKPNRSLRPLTH